MIEDLKCPNTIKTIEITMPHYDKNYSKKLQYQLDTRYLQYLTFNIMADTWCLKQITRF